ncbi:hypothetical protein F511_23436 [Dorcoceras hygrometricum]|uniref:Uncharacterized protein n=1 Tax=Dorcoceras hygrometricum TaxID=472368 RepID=A0A2Z7D9I6_9LAMI|nr:hypothetical protein F511_23436 [Dorcoceras hygrometricum]
MTFRVVRTNQYNQDLGLIHSTNGNHLESPNEGSSIDHHVTIHLHAQNITMFPTNETWRLAPTSYTRKPALQTVGGGRSSIRSTTGIKTPSSACTRRTDEFSTDENTSARWPEQVRRRGGGGGAWRRPAAA